MILGFPNGNFEAVSRVRRYTRHGVDLSEDVAFLVQDFFEVTVHQFVLHCIVTVWRVPVFDLGPYLPVEDTLQFRWTFLSLKIEKTCSFEKSPVFLPITVTWAHQECHSMTFPIKQLARHAWLDSTEDVMEAWVELFAVPPFKRVVSWHLTKSIHTHPNTILRDQVRLREKCSGFSFQNLTAATMKKVRLS